MKHIYSMLVTIIFICNVIFIVIFQMSELNKMSNLYANDLQSNKSVKIFVTPNENVKYKDLYELANDYSIVIFNEIYSDKTLKIWGIIGDSFENIIDNIDENNDNLIKKHKLCAVGKNIITENNCFEFKNERYEVTSVINNEIYNMLDNTVYITLDSTNYNPNNGFIIDSTNEKMIEDAINFLSNKFDIKTEKSNNLLQRYILSSININIIYAMSLCIIISLYAVAIITLNAKLKTEICTKLILGINKYTIIKEMIINMIICYGVSEFLFCLIYYLTLAKYIKKVNLQLYDTTYLIFLLCTITVIVINLILWVYYLSNHLKENIDEET